ncbi:MAG: NAD(P)-binding protein, partial [Brachymonas sp.]|nr:NAD(P)-binding protein [Brachymonas sp.]
MTIPADSMRTSTPHIAIVGAGWAGCAAAVRAVQLGAQVTLFEASRTAGGRARSVPRNDVPGAALDNGQHILLGAYNATLDLMRTVHADPQRLLLRLPLDLRTPEGHGLRLPAKAFTPQLAVLQAVMQARGWSWAEKYRFLTTAARWQLQAFTCPAHHTVADVCQGLGEQVMRSLIVPLCVAAFNSAPEHTSGAVFLRVLHDALLSQPQSSDALIALVPFGQVLPEPTLAWLQAAGARLALGQRVVALQKTAQHRWHLSSSQHAASDGYDHLILACSAWEAARLAGDWAQQNNTSAHIDNSMQWA